MNLRFNVAYPATDGSMPESVDVELTELTPDDADLAQAILGMLLRAPAGRSVTHPTIRTDGPATGLLVENVAKGAMLGYMSNSRVVAVENQSAGTKFDYVGRAAEDLYTGTVIRLEDGIWRRV